MKICYIYSSVPIFDFLLNLQYFRMLLLRNYFSRSRLSKLQIIINIIITLIAYYKIL